jgi:hypothetical protein
MRWAGHVVHTGEERKVHKILVGKPKQKRPIRRWEDGIGIDVR